MYPQRRPFPVLLLALILAVAIPCLSGYAQQAGHMAPPIPMPTPGGQPAHGTPPARPIAPSPQAPPVPQPAPAAAPAAGAPQAAAGSSDIVRDQQGVPLASLDFPNKAPISVILSDYSAQTSVTVSAFGKAGETEATISGENMTPEQFLTRLADANKLVWRKTDEGYQLWDEESYKREVLPTRVLQKIFIPINLKADDFYEAIKRSNILTPDNIGGAWVDKRTNQVVVVDLPEKLAMVQDLQNLIDVPQFTRTFYIRYANMDDIIKKIDEMQLKSEPGTIETDPGAHLIIVRDILPNIQRMEALIEMLDVRQPERIYKLNSIGSDEEELNALNESLKVILTPDAYYYLDAKRGMLLVRDIPEVHRDIERFLKYFNSPVPQVLIQAELFEVDQTLNLSYGTELTYNQDLPSAVKDGLVSNFTNTGTSPDSPFGFIDYRKEFPTVAAGAGGLDIKYLSSHIKAELKAALTDTNSRLLLRPNIMVKNRETAVMNVVTDEPIATVIPLGDNTNQFSVSQSSVPSGLELSFSPTVSPTGLVEVKLSISNSTSERIELATGIVSGVSTIQGVKTNRDSAETIMIVPDGQTEVISGLIRRARTETNNGVPILVNIPWIGPLLFGSKSDVRGTRNLLFFLTPNIIYAEGKESPVIHEYEGFDMKEGAKAPAAAVGVGEIGKTTNGVLAEGRRFEAPLPAKVGTKDEYAKALRPERAPNSEAGLAEMLGTETGRLPEALGEPEKVIKESYKVRPGAPVATGETPPPARERPTPPTGLPTATLPPGVPTTPTAAVPPSPSVPVGAAPVAPTPTSARPTPYYPYPRGITPRQTPSATQQSTGGAGTQTDFYTSTKKSGQ